MTDTRGSSSLSPLTSDVLVIGCGVLGASIALAASKEGKSVTVVDELKSAGFGSTSASAGIVRVHAGDVESSLLAWEGTRYWETWRDFLGVDSSVPSVSFRRTGSYILDDGGSAFGQIQRVLDASGAPYEYMTGQELRQSLPWMDLRRFGPPDSPENPDFWKDPDGYIERGIYTPTSGYVSEPALAAQNMATCAGSFGARLLFGYGVVEVLEESTGYRAKLSDGTEISAAVIVNAAGPGSQRVNEILRVGEDFCVSQRAVRHELHQVHIPGFPGELAHVVDGDLGINFRPEGDGMILAGGSGSPRDPEEVVDGASEHNESPTRAAWWRHVARVARRVPEARIPPKPIGIAGLYDVTEDWLPIYDKTSRPGIFVAIGTSGTQFKTSPVVGQLMLRVINEYLEGADTDKSAVQFELPNIQKCIDLSVFSRLRKPKERGLRG